MGGNSLGFEARSAPDDLQPYCAKLPLTLRAALILKQSLIATSGQYVSTIAQKKVCQDVCLCYLLSAKK